jgi:protein disulfide-isomerase
LFFFKGLCGWCIRLQKRGFKTPEFAWAKENVVLVELDYPRRAPQTEEIKNKMKLQMVFEFKGSNHIANATTKEGKVNFEGIGSTGYVAGGPTALAVANGFLKNKSTIYLIF